LTALGLTIHYSLKSDADTPEQARHLVEQLRQAALDLPFAEVSEIVELSGADCDLKTAPQDDTIRWLLTQARHMISVGEQGYCFVTPAHIIAFSAWPGEDCEVANFGLAAYPNMVQSEDHPRATGLQGWSWACFCKTQYSSNPTQGGVENFVRCHLLVIRLLDRAKELGILEKVVDEGGYWEKRDVKALVETVGEWNRYVAAVVGKYKNLFTGDVSAPITGYPNFEHLEAEGRRKKSE
jgi:hypothetical protein